MTPETRKAWDAARHRRELAEAAVIGTVRALVADYRRGYLPTRASMERLAEASDAAVAAQEQEHACGERAVEATDVRVQQVLGVR